METPGEFLLGEPDRGKNRQKVIDIVVDLLIVEDKPWVLVGCVVEVAELAHLVTEEGWCAPYDIHGALCLRVTTRLARVVHATSQQTREVSLRIARLALVTHSATLAYPGTPAGNTLVLVRAAVARALALPARHTAVGHLSRMFFTHAMHLHPSFAFTFDTDAPRALLLVIIWAHAMSLFIPYDLQWWRGRLRERECTSFVCSDAFACQSLHPHEWAFCIMRDGWPGRHFCPFEELLLCSVQ